MRTTVEHDSADNGKKQKTDERVVAAKLST